MSSTNKIISTLGLLCAFLLILITGRTNVRNFENIQSSIEEIYEDRLVVKGLIFDLKSLIHNKEVALILNDKSFYMLKNEAINEQIEDYIVKFRATKLTSFEGRTLNRFSERVLELKNLEKEIEPTAKVLIGEEGRKKLIDKYISLKEDLKTLAGIQLAEGKRKLTISDKAIDSMYTFATAENYILVIFAILMLVIIFVVPAKKNQEV